MFLGRPEGSSGRPYILLLMFFFYFFRRATSELPRPIAVKPVASTRVQGWGDEVVPPPQKIFCFVISKWHVLVNSKGVNLKFFFSQQL